jgi:hypothetical protein
MSSPYVDPKAKLTIGLALGGVVVVGLACAGVITLGIKATGIDHLSQAEIRAGRPCTATMLSIKETNFSQNSRRVYEFTLRVQPADGAAAYEDKVRDTLKQLEAARVGTGTAEFRCVIDRDDPSRVEVFW